jgi:hypothetical protein
MAARAVLALARRTKPLRSLIILDAVDITCMAHQRSSRLRWHILCMHATRHCMIHAQHSKRCDQVNL